MGMQEKIWELEGEKATLSKELEGLKNSMARVKGAAEVQRRELIEASEEQAETEARERREFSMSKALAMLEIVSSSLQEKPEVRPHAIANWIAGHAMLCARIKETRALLMMAQAPGSQLVEEFALTAHHERIAIKPNEGWGMYDQVSEMIVKLASAIAARPEEEKTTQRKPYAKPRVR